MNEFDRAACEEFSRLRKEKHITSYRDKWNLEGICSYNTLLRYGSGKASFIDMPFYLAVASFSPLDCRPDDFLLRNYPIRSELDSRMRGHVPSISDYDWLGSHKRADYEYLREKANNRIFYLKRRGTIDDNTYDELMNRFKNVFSPSNCLSDSFGRYFSDDDYIGKVIPLVHEIDKASIMGNDKINSQGKVLRCRMIDKRLGIDDIIYLADISKRTFFYCQKDMDKLGHLPFSKIVCISLALDIKYDIMFSIYLHSLPFYIS